MDVSFAEARLLPLKALTSVTTALRQQVCLECNIFTETAKHKRVQAWERIYLTYGAEGLSLERRGRGGKGKPAKLRNSGRGFNCGRATFTGRERLPKKFTRLGVGTDTVGDRPQVVTALRQKHKLEILLDVAGLSRATYYYHAKRLEQPDKYSEIKGRIQNICDENKGRFGYRRATLELKSRGFVINHKTMQRLML